MNKNKRKGTAAESAFVNFMVEHGFVYVERRSLKGKADRGDISGLPGVVIEIKSGSRLAIPEWLKELEVEMVNDGSSEGYLIIKPKGKGKGRVEDWWVVTTVGQWLPTMRKSQDVQAVEPGLGSGRSVANVRGRIETAEEGL